MNIHPQYLQNSLAQAATVPPYRRRGRSLAVVLATAILAAGHTAAQPCYCNIQIDSGTLTFNGDIQLNCVKVDTDAVLNVCGTLTLNGEDCAETKIDGVVNLSYATSRLAFTDNDHLLTGNGEIIGISPQTRITLDSNDLTVTNNTTICGMLTITEYGTPSNTSFVNTGLIHADTAGTLDITGLDSLGASSGDWRVSTSGSAVLRINVECTSMSSRFDVNAGTLDIDQNVTTTGEYEQTGGELDVAAGKMFQAG